MYSVYVNNIKVKSYPFKMQAIIYCYMKGYVNSGGYGSGKFNVLDKKVKVVKE